MGSGYGVCVCGGGGCDSMTNKNLLGSMIVDLTGLTLTLEDKRRLASTHRWGDFVWA